eukprot:1511820-Prymnesium_polylepis.2
MGQQFHVESTTGRECGVEFGGVGRVARATCASCVVSTCASCVRVPSTSRPREFTLDAPSLVPSP